MKDIILASTSVYRRNQLQQLKVDFSAMSPEVDEEPIKQEGLDHIQLSKQLALLKARAISTQHPDAIVIGGDQVASFDGGISDSHQPTLLSKPKTKEKAFEQLRALSGNQHRLITSVAMISNHEERVYTCIAKMTMRSLTDRQITTYIDADDPLQCCGSYRVEALGISLFETIECDDHTSIIGLPLMWTARTLSAFGVPVP